MGKVLINASNLHVGGGVQVATSVIGELTLIPELPSGLVVWASSEVDVNLRSQGFDLSALPVYEVVNTVGLKMLCSSIVRQLRHFDAVLTVFGPLYAWKMSAVNITGFAQAWIIYPENEVYRNLNNIQRFIFRLRFALQSIFFARADILLVELEHVRQGLLTKGMGSEQSIFVIRNCLSSLYLNPDSWMPLSIVDTPVDIRLGFVGRNYVHKNTAIFPDVVKILLSDYGIKASIFVTFTDEEWASCGDDFRASINNVGPLFAAQCPEFYRSMDAVIFPSLLECFSATPLEAMVMERPLFVSDRPFNHDICGAHAHYFDPLSPADVADKIATYLRGRDRNLMMLKEAREYALSFSNATNRARQYLDCLMSAAGGVSNSSIRSLNV